MPDGAGTEGPPAGMWIALRDGRRLAAEQHGDGGPTVVLEAGMGMSRNLWGAVIDELLPHTTVVAYDRSGLGHSDADVWGPRDLGHLVDDLLQLLDQLDGPFVLVGHSWGGPIVRCAATRRPEVVAGLVLVDQTDEHCGLFFGPAARRTTRIACVVLPLAARLGLTALAARRLARDLPEPWASAMRSVDGTRAAAVTQVDELRCHLDDLERLRSNPPHLPDVPAAVISGAVAGVGERSRRRRLIQAHQMSATLLPRGRHVLAEHSSHQVPVTDPLVVVAEILSIVDAV